MERIKWPLLLSLGAGIIILLTVSLVSSNLSLQHYGAQDFRSRIESAHKLLRQSLEREGESLASLAVFCLNDPTLRSAFLARDRQALYDASLPIFRQAGDNESLSGFAFINPDRTIFLRLHEPDHFGDILSFPFLATAAKGRGTVTIGTTANGLLTVSMVYPLNIEGRLEGYIHLTRETHALLPRLKKILGVELAFLPGNDSMIPDQSIPVSDSGPGLRAQEGSGPSQAFASNCTLPVMPVGLAEKIHQYSRPDQGRLFETTVGRQKYLAGFFPLFDTGGSQLGDVVVLEDVSVENRARLQFSLVESVVALITGGLLFILFWVFIGRIEQRLVKTHADLEHEVTERRRTQASFSETNQILEDIAQGITESILLLSKDFKILWANRHALEETGHKLDDIIDKNCYKITHHLEEPCQPPNDVCPLHELLETGKPTREEHVHFDKDDNKIVVAVTAYPIRDTTGAITKFVHVSKDITERKQAEEDRERLVAELQQALGEVKTLSGMLPICSSCKKIRDDRGYWKQIESYIRDHSEAEFSHGICPDCFEDLYPEYCNDDEPEN